MTAKPRPQVAVGAVAIRDGKLLLVRRGQGPLKGTWSLPGGRVEHGETLAEALVRELREETGLAVGVGTLCGIAERIIGGHHYVILDYWVDLPAGADPHPGDDADAVGWASRSDLESLALVPRLMEFLAEHDLLERLT